jgi:squalene-associated FAD-dependent desaturase
VPGTECTDVIVIGGGLAGLACACALADHALRVTVLESSDVPGGRARSWRHRASGVDVDIGPHVVHSEYANFLKFLERLGTRGRITWERRKLINIVDADGTHALRHRALPAPFSLLPDLVRVRALGPRDVLSNMRITRLALGFQEAHVQSLDSLSALELLHLMGTRRAMIEWFWRLASMAVMNVPLELCSAAALMRVHAQLIGRPRVYFGFPAVGLSDLYVGAAARVIERAGGHVSTRTEVTQVDHSGSVHLATTADGRRFRARHCVYALPPAALGRVAPGLADTATFEPSPYKSVYLWFDGSLTNERFVALRSSPANLNCDFYDLSKIRPSLRGAPTIFASNIVYSHRAGKLSDDEIVARTLGEIAQFAPAVTRSRLLHADIHDIPMAIPSPLVGTESRRPRTRTALPGVFLCGDWIRTGLPCSMESAVKSGYLAAEAVLAAEGRSRALAVEPRPMSPLARWLASDEAGRVRPARAPGTLRDRARSA